MRANLRTGDMKDQLSLSYCHQFFRGHTNYWAHDAEVDSLRKSSAAREVHLFSKGPYSIILKGGGREVVGQRVKTKSEEII